MGEMAKARAGIRWDSVVEKVWKDVGGNQKEIMSSREAWKVQGRRRKKDRNRGKANAKKQGEIGETFRRYGGD